MSAICCPACGHEWNEEAAPETSRKRLLTEIAGNLKEMNASNLKGAETPQGEMGELLLDTIRGDSSHLKGRTLGELPDMADAMKPQRLSREALAEEGGLTLEQLALLEEARLLVPRREKTSPHYEPKNVRWAGKLAYLLCQGWSIEEIRHWTKERWKSFDPRRWPPQRPIIDQSPTTTTDTERA